MTEKERWKDSKLDQNNKTSWISYKMKNIFIHLQNKDQEIKYNDLNILRYYKEKQKAVTICIFTLVRIPVFQRVTKWKLSS